MLPTITLGTVSIDMYTTMIGIAALGMLVFLLNRRKKTNMTVFQTVIFTMIFTVCGVVEVMLLSFFEWSVFGGTNIFGAVYLTPLIMPIFGKLFGITALRTLDVSAVLLLITAGMIKIGCLFAGCCEGIVLYVGNAYFQWPAQIVGSICGFLMLLWFLRIEASEKNRGALYPLFMLSYGIMRIILDHFEYMPPQDLWFGLHHSQCFGLIAAVIGFVWLLIYKNGASKYVTRV